MNMALPTQWQQQLAVGLPQLDTELNATQQQQLVDYLILLQRWNKTFNLTAIRDPQQMVSRQLLDSLSILPWITGARVLDVGSGAGLPGIPLAIARPEQQFVLLDAKGKKTRFIQHAITQLALANVVVEQTRVETYQPAAGFHTITARAFSRADTILQLTQPLRAQEGHWALMLGQPIAPDPAWFAAAQLHYQMVPLQIPDMPDQRHVLHVW